MFMSDTTSAGGMEGTSKSWWVWPTAGSTGCTFGVIGLYAGATGDEEPSLDDE
jgi:hypothetical protein